ncbi:MAG: hypothetical protein KA764_14360 [Anaerolineales bacterium]|nr:hypothetical protein [Anaerolineales bacterium]
MPRRFYLLVVAATLAGAWLRVWQLTAVPPGLHYDLAATALLGNDVAFNGYRPLFITAYTGHEVLFYYWLAAWFNLIGSSIFSLRLAAALIGVLTIPAAFFAIREVLHTEPEAWQTAALAAGLLASAFFHVTFSRFGFRVITEPLVQSLALGFLLRGWRRWSAGASAPAPLKAWPLSRGRLDLLLAGAFTGLAAYTYLSARLFPFPLAVFWLGLLIGAVRRPRLTRSPNLVVFFQAFVLFVLAALVVFAPLGLYFLQHPADFLNRAGQVLPRPGDDALLWQGVRRAAEMVFINGEPYDRFNLPGLPLFGFPLGGFFVLGLLLTLRNVIRPRRGALAAADWLLLAWLPFMLLPTALSVHDVFPSNVRAFGLTPLVFVFPARGLLAAYRWLQRQSPGPLLPTAYPVTVLSLVILVAGAGVTYRDYFLTWATLSSQRLNNDADITEIAAYLNTQTLAETTPYVTAIHYRHPTLAYLARDYEAIQWLTGGRSLAVPADRAALYLEAASAPLPAEWTAGWDAYLVGQQLGADNHPEYRAFRFAAGAPPPLPEFAPLAENFGHAIFLTGARLTPARELVTVDLRWRVENPVATADFLPYARLYDAAGRVWVQSVDYTYPSAQWAAGDTVLTRLTLRLPAGLPAGAYTVKAGLFSEGAGVSLPRLDENGNFGGERAEAGTVTLAGGPPATAADFRAANPMTPPEQAPAGALALLGYHLSAASVQPNQRLEVTLFWQAAQPVTRPVEIRLGETGLTAVPITVSDVLITRLTLRVPLDQPAGPAPLQVVIPGQGVARLQAVTVAPLDRAYTAPVSTTAVGAAFGEGRLLLAGYTLAPGAPTTLRLVWQAGARQLDQDYTVFVHVRAEDGQMAAQADQTPRAGAYPTSWWAPGEFVAEDYTFDLPPGRYTLSLGVYDVETGQRLSVSPAADAVDLGTFIIP